MKPTVLIATILILTGCTMDLRGLNGQDMKLELHGTPTEYQQWNENSLKLF